ncbi:hypothetical protein FQR65_LT06525 [Abscondita terminalis]|nr:hypothetical protein FQR65_LT06525 [Abscondita terminalis]
MYFNFKHRVILITYLICAFLVIVESKRGGGGRRGGTYRGSSVWSKSKQSQTGSNYDLYGSNRRGSKSQLDDSKTIVKPDIPKASAPPSPKDGQKSSSAFINKEKEHDSVPKPIGFEQANKNAPNTQQRPIGWDVNHGNVQTQAINKNVASGQPSGINNPAHTASGNPSGMNNPTHTASGNPSSINTATHITGQQTYPSYNNQQQSYQSNIGTHASYPVQPGANSYGAGQHYNYGNVHNQPQQQFPGYQQGMGGVPYQNPNTGLHYNNMGYSQGYGNSYGGGGYGGGYGRSGGMFGSMFGGNNHGYGGYGGFGSGIGGYGRKFGGGFGMGFGKNAYRNAFFGLLIWNLFSGFTRRPYYVYNYYNNPEKAPKEISLPANLIVMCPENVTTLCAPNTAPLCTSNSTILCVVLAQETVPCENNSNIKCAKSIATCGDGGDENCQEGSTTNKTAAVNVPCITNATVMAVPQPEDDIKAAEAAGCGPTSEQGQNSTCNANISSPLHNTTITNLNSTYPLAM